MLLYIETGEAVSENICAVARCRNQGDVNDFDHVAREAIRLKY